MTIVGAGGPRAIPVALSPYAIEGWVSLAVAAAGETLGFESSRLGIDMARRDACTGWASATR